VVIKTIIKKTTGSVSAVSFDTGESFLNKTSAYDTFLQVIDGEAQIEINGVFQTLKTGESIIIPANTLNSITAKVRFKMLSTIIKSALDD